MSTDCTSTLEDLRVKAAREFARTMIFVDDEAAQFDDETHVSPISSLKKPEIRSKPKHTDKSQPEESASPRTKYVLNAKKLVDSAMDVGLVCSVLRPSKDDDFTVRVVEAAKYADIVCLDWEFFGEKGTAAKDIISKIIENDANCSGRIRLVAIYTGDKKSSILEQILGEIPERQTKTCDISENPFTCELETGARLVCLFKKNGVELHETAEEFPYQVDEMNLPNRLLREFGELSKGLMSNVALATIASIRHSTHHVLSNFTRSADGPYFHHRALLENPEDAEEYAIDVVVSELKGTIDKQKISSEYAGTNAINQTIQKLAGSNSKLTLNCGDDTSSEVELGNSIDIVTAGLESAYQRISGNRPKMVKLEKYLSSLFTTDWNHAYSQMLKFSALTSLHAVPGNYLYGNAGLVPQLGLGTIIRNADDEYLLCLQAKCDSVRIDIEESFLFIRLERVKANVKPEHTVPVPDPDSDEYVELELSADSYRGMKLIKFMSDETSKTVRAKREQAERFYFVSGKGEDKLCYLWVADMKQSRALRSAQKIAHNIGRLGFDEFEPFRRN